ncbi:acetyltransferase, GNAT family protein [Trichomonas vaginalis G3]|uniref:Acetyltransferase, GNAT family protein n=1 Tax=Trichomonas vaginalis (strain ATCC PRA-98 / G3) TaxID=412133 RepID=A2EK54_TRIV3|nr:N-terminal peptidyl-glutamic acid acetylation [Trichomonas vaginalis G3]EAY06947.1 acetyltransferase, GNAT family protein [Trichomonas vaginalis G3]KAI5499098.1 N-terminal peptidyl-glutamic acid acetylation [Trichomonas vaginalis G3]|eukprot:XP_001319170.1 acetyltransferase, GNAT family protein [Trichomonas vaginalis G3]
MPISVRRVKITDLNEMQQTNLSCLAENYHMWFWLYHYLIYPASSHCAVDSLNHILGYVLSKMDDDSRRKNPNEPLHALMTSVAVYNGYRKLGLAKQLMLSSQRENQLCYKAEYVLLHVRETNRAGHLLYENSLGYVKNQVCKEYYVDGEDAWSMKLVLPKTEAQLAEEAAKKAASSQPRKPKKGGRR